ncbi:MAG: MerR family transcriptional regulator [Pseudomonadales bacterium]|nr:MerR family transcriptional regulator [Pseudomonadales bacterium]
MQTTAAQSFPIRAVSEITGVNSVTLRAWERRYGLIKPMRTPKGHRLYSQQDIELIQNVLGRLSQGMSISQIARDILDEASMDDGEYSDAWSQYCRQMVEAVSRFDERALENVYNDAMSLYPVDVVFTRLIMPLLEELGKRWQKKRGGIAEEHFFSVYLRNKLGARFHHQNLRSRGPKLIMACLPGEYHEFGILLFALTAHSKGYQVILLGADLPVDELIQVAERTDSQGVVLAGSASLSCSSVMADINLLADTISIPVFIGGDFSFLCRDDITKANVFPLSHDLVGSLYTIANRLNGSS